MQIGTAKHSYRADEALLTTRPQRLWMALFALSLCAAPFLLDNYWLYLACLVAINVASATGLNILTGYTGLVSLGQAAFMAVGAYTVGWMQLNLPTPFLLNLLAGGFTGGPGRPCRRPAEPEGQGAVPGHRHHRRLLHPAFRLRQLGEA